MLNATPVSQYECCVLWFPLIQILSSVFYIYDATLPHTPTQALSHPCPPPLPTPLTRRAAKALRDQEGPLTPELEAVVQAPPATVEGVQDLIRT